MDHHRGTGNRCRLTAGRRHPASRLTAVAMLLVLLPALAWGAGHAATTDTTEKQYRLARAMYRTLEANETLAASRAAWRTCLQLARKTYLARPQEDPAAKALLLLGHINRSMGRRLQEPELFAEAAGYYNDVARLFPAHPLADDALFTLARMHCDDLLDDAGATAVLARLVQQCPAGDMVGPAERLLTDIKAPAGGQPPAPADTGAQGGDGPVQLLPIAHWSSINYTRVVIKTTAPAVFKAGLLEQNGHLPRMLYIDLDNCRLPTPPSRPVPIRDGLLQQVRFGQFTPDIVRVVLDIESIAKYRIFSLQDPFRVVIDVEGDNSAAAVRRPTPAAALPDGPVPSLAQQFGLSIGRIVIDPGHGGRDPGAIGPNGLREKDIVLAVARKLAALLRQQLGCEVVLTRSQDVSLPLEERTAIANTTDSDLFVSIHANAAPRQTASGVETYYLDLTDDAAAMRLAALENATSTAKMSDLQAILADLLRNAKKEESARLADFVQNAMASGLGLENLGVKRAPFYVLVGAQMPAILSEITFLSNPAEAGRLQHDSYLTAIAEQLASGVAAYVNNSNATQGLTGPLR